jgi:hypothetical protein
MQPFIGNLDIFPLISHDVLPKFALPGYNPIVSRRTTPIFPRRTTQFSPTREITYKTLAKICA